MNNIVSNDFFGKNVRNTTHFITPIPILKNNFGNSTIPTNFVPSMLNSHNNNKQNYRFNISANNMNDPISNTYELIPLSKPIGTYSSNNSTNLNGTIAKNELQNKEDEVNLSKHKIIPFGQSASENQLFLTCTVETLIHWNKTYSQLYADKNSHFCYFAVIGSVICIKDSNTRGEKILLLRDKRGPILQIIYFQPGTSIQVEQFEIGQKLRCVGRMIGSNILSAVRIRIPNAEEIAVVQRHCYIGDNTLMHLQN